MKNDQLKILFFGDIVGRPGRYAVTEYLAQNRSKYDFVIANGENLSSGKGMTYDKYQEMIRAGIDYFTSGNHIWRVSEFVEYLDDRSTKVIRPANYPPSSPGFGDATIDLNGIKLVLINLQGRVFMYDNLDDPFTVAKKIVDQNKDAIIIVDFHAEATSEKVALGYYLDGSVSAVIGTHTHVQTADERILEGGTAYISDLGMCGPRESVLGVKKEIIIERFLTQLPQSHKVAVGDSFINAVEIEIDKKTKKAIKIKRLEEIYQH